ncbi:MAG TPA: glucoamylase family protein [Pyrinomonadaceae bacterium]|nr:glucoamylase family protein [Pyrinomonadaceae bacterium]
MRRLTSLGLHASRSFKRRAFALFLLIVCAFVGAAAPVASAADARPFVQTETGVARLSAADEAFLEDLSRRAFRYFWEHGDASTGLVLDRARTSGEAHGPEHQSHNITSSATTGFGLTALCIGVERGWVTRAEARERVVKTLRFFAERAPQEHGWFLHWMDGPTGERRWRSEFSSIDTALLLAGVLTARQFFSDDAEVVRLSTAIYERVDFAWMLGGHPSLLSHGWKPESGFLKARWDSYSEHLILQLLAVGSPAHAISPAAWRAWSRKRITYAGRNFISDGPLFVHQYSHAWVDFRGLSEGWYPFTNYFANSIEATRAHREFCVDLSREFPGYSANVWGISASDSPKGYVAWGGPPRHPAIDGTVVPCAAGGSLMFTPDISLAALREMRERFGAKIYGRYGFADAFNPTTGWVAADVIGIDLGITLLSAENLRTGGVWRHFMRNPEIERAMRLVGLRPEGSKKAKGKSKADASLLLLPAFRQANNQSLALF